MGSGKNIMELVQQQLFPAFPQLLRRIFRSPEGGQGADQLRFPQPELQRPVEFFQVGFGGEGAPVHLQIQLAGRFPSDFYAGNPRPRSFPSSA